MPSEQWLTIFEALPNTLVAGTTSLCMHWHHWPTSPHVHTSISLINIIESDEIPAFSLQLATQKSTELIKQLTEVDNKIMELFLNDALSH